MWNIYFGNKCLVWEILSAYVFPESNLLYTENCNHLMHCCFFLINRAALGGFLSLSHGI